MKRTVLDRGLRRLLCLLALLVLSSSLSPSLAMAQEGKEITKRCKITMPGDAERRAKAFDRRYSTLWSTICPRVVKITIAPPKDVVSGGLYICWGDIPDEWTVSRQDAVLYKGNGDDFAHVYIPFEGNEPLTLSILKGEKDFASISEIFVFSGNTPPDFVQRWQPALEQCDLMVVSAHPDDEFLFMGGTIPYYIAQGKRVLVCYMTCKNTFRRNELLNGLWAVGVRNYPVIFYNRDKRFPNKEVVYRKWDMKAVEGDLVSLIRKHRPSVVVTHDLNGEYGHVVHKITADVVCVAAEAAGDEKQFPESAKEYGAYDLPKLYLHLYEKNAVQMNWEEPLPFFNNRSAFEMAVIGFDAHKTQHKNWKVKKGGAMDNAAFGLYRTTVGEDTGRNDFFENIGP